ncbi:piggyBac transposable element-derived protein 2 [Ditylenchus destructor]|uniref:PiggyBac transposable element-derived protein 2 n=1 Tax=Ditylenchus destructor TaxID=166010 RepID=A0AAD4N651_9BILA|nr:piggyBac transposable element-derived protein 2 [Ditylenchus destructor]
MLPRFLCSKCGQYDFMTINDLETHIVEKHFCDLNALYKCWFANCSKLFPTEDKDFVSRRLAIYGCLNESVYQTFSRLTEPNGNNCQGPTTSQFADISSRKRARVFQIRPIHKDELETTAHPTPAQSSSDLRHNFCDTNDAVEERRKSLNSSNLITNPDCLNESVDKPRSMSANSSAYKLGNRTLENSGLKDENNKKTDRENAQMSCVMTAEPSLVNVLVTASPALSNNETNDQKIMTDVSSKSPVVKDEPIDELADATVIPDQNDSFPANKEETIRCSVCSKTFKPPSNTSNLMDHWSRKHRDEEWPVGGQKTINKTNTTNVKQALEYLEELDIDAIVGADVFLEPPTNENLSDDAYKQAPKRNSFQAQSRSKKQRVSEDIRYDHRDHWIMVNGTQIRCAQCGKCTNRKCEKCGVGLHDQCFKAYHVDS